MSLQGRDIELLQQEISLVDFYRKNPIIAAQDILNVRFPVPQRAVFEDMWFKNYVLVTAGRGCGKTHNNAVFACLWAVLFPGQRVGLLAPSFRQVKTMFAEVEKIWSRAPLLQEATQGKPVTQSDRCILKFRQAGSSSPSIVEGAPLGDGCLTGNHYVLTEDSFTRLDELVRIKDFNIDHQVFPFGKKIWSNGKFRYCDEVYYNGIRDTIRITTNRGYSIEGTLNHKIKIIRQGNIEWVRFDETRLGDRVLIDPFYHRHKNKTTIELLEKINSEDVYYDFVTELESGNAPTYDVHIPDGHEYCAAGFFSHNSKIRGARYYVIIADEFAQIPETIFNSVIVPMGATVADPMENVERIRMIDELVKTGKAVKEDFDGVGGNKLLMTSSAYYQFNHMYSAIQSYKKAIEEGSDKYAVHTISYRDMPKGFLEENNIAVARKRLSSPEFRMEYEAVWEADSAGVFKASLIEKCRAQEMRTVALKGELDKQYILGIDPARQSDAFAMCLIELGTPSVVAAAWEYYQIPYPKMADLVIEICDLYNVTAVHMDAGAGGGGLALADILADRDKYQAHRLLDVESEENENSPGRRILHMFKPSPTTTAEAVYATLNLMEQGNLTFPIRPRHYTTPEELDAKEALYETVENLIRQVLLITASQSKSGVAHFDVPSGGGHGTQKKDLFTAFILAAKKVYDLALSIDEGPGILEVGLIEDWTLPKAPLSGKLENNLSVSQVPLNSWAQRKTFVPSK